MKVREILGNVDNDIPGESEKTWGVCQTVKSHLAIRLSSIKFFRAAKSLT